MQEQEVEGRKHANPRGQLSEYLIRLELKEGERGQLCDFRGNVPGEEISCQIQLLEGAETHQLRRKLAREEIVHELNRLGALERSQLAGDRPSEFPVGLQVKLADTAEETDLTGDRTRQSISRKAEDLESSKLADEGRDGLRKVI